MKKALVIKIALVLGAVAVGGVISTPATKAAGTCPVSIAAVQSNGTYIFAPDDNAEHTVKLYASDITNLASEVNSLGVWTDEHITTLNGQVSTASSNVNSLSNAVTNLTQVCQ